MDAFIRSVLFSLAAIVTVTGLAFGMPSAIAAGDDSRADQAMLKRDEDDVEAALAREDDDEDDPTTGVGDVSNTTGTTADASNSLDSSRDQTTSERSYSLDRSRDATGDGVGVNDRSHSKDQSRDRTGDHNSADFSRSHDVSQDNTTAA